MSLFGRVAARRLGTPETPGSTAVTTFPPSEQRVLIAPVNYSGQGRAWSAAIEHAAPSIAARNMAIDVPGGFSFVSDLLVPVSVYHNDRLWQRRQLDAVASHATHVLVEAEEPLFGRLMRRDLRRQIEALRERNVHIAFMAHGTDIRLPSRHVTRTPWSLYNDHAVYTPRLEYLAKHNREILDRSGGPVFVSTPDLLADVSNGIWCPVVVDVSRWQNIERTRCSSENKLRVVHAPSASVNKGTPLVLPVLDRLHQEGVIEFSLVSGVASEDMPAVFHKADVLLDQFRAGSYGVAACEAMAAGAVVVGHVIDDVRDVVKETTGIELPVIEATPDTLEQVLRGLAADRNRLDDIRDAGVGFVSEVHDGRLSAHVLIDSWLKPGTT
ncbi:hypothetical protein [Salinibacterium sp. PAMC 21357]|uniref:hypothetical protein n=1 Tax=Salinibacterium sp. PAMC 21357 TaxID=1112215 RepID=UPI001300C633|nr:hypothetical protein [Salinibacterium sp. PAMC 21357]